MRIPSESDDRYIYFVAVDATDLKTRETGLASFTVRRSRNGGASAAFTSPTINETDSSNMPGVYELLIDEDTEIAAGNDTEEMVLHITHAGMAPVTRVIELYRPETSEGKTLLLGAGGKLGSATIDAGSIANDAQYELDRSLLHRTTISSLTGGDQTLVVLASGSTDLNAYKDCIAVITDQSTSTQRAFARITQSTAGRQLTLDRTPSFTIAADDKIDILLSGATSDEVDTALSDIHLDHLFAVDYDPASKPGVSTALLNELIQNSTGGDAGISQFTANALENAPSGTGESAESIATEVWDRALESHVTAGTFGAAGQGGVRRGTGIHNIVRSDTAQAQGGTPDNTHIKLDNTANSATDDYYVGMSITLTAGTGSGSKSVITDYVASARTCTVSPAFGGIPDATTKFTIWETNARHLGGDGVPAALAAINLNYLMKDAVANEDDMTAEVADESVLCNIMTATQNTSDYDHSLHSLNAGPKWALREYNLNHLMFEAAAENDVADDSVIAHLVDDAATADWSNFSNEDHSLKAIKSNSAWDTADVSGLSTLTAEQVNTEVDSAIETYHLDQLVHSAVVADDVADNSIIARIVSKESTADWDDFDNTTDSLQAASTLLSSVDTIADKLDTTLESDGSGGSQFTALGLENAPSGTGASAATIAAEVWNTTLTSHQTPTTFGGGLQRAALLYSNAIPVGGVTSQTQFVLADGTHSTNADSYEDCIAVITDAGDRDVVDVRRITSYAPGTRTVTIDSAPDNTIAEGDYLTIIPTLPVDKFATGAIDAAALAESAITEIADGIWDALTSSHTTDNSFGKAVSEIKAQTVDSFAELGQGIPTATPTMEQAIMYLYMALRNKLTVTATEKAIYNDAGTKITKKTLSDDGTTYTESEAVSGE